MDNLFRYQRFLKLTLFGVLILRFFLDLFGEWNPGSVLPYELTSPATKKWYLYINADEKEISRTAFQWLNNKGFITDESSDRPQYNQPDYRQQGKWWPTALRNRYNILGHAFLIKIYTKFEGPVTLNEKHNLPDGYFSFYSFILFVLKWILTLISLIFLFRCARVFLSPGGSLAFVLLWALYPSNFFIFPINMWDTLAAPLTAIIISKLIIETTKDKVSARQMIWLALLTTLTFTLKFHTLLIFLFAYGVVFVFGVLKRRKTLIWLACAVGLAHLFVFTPLWYATNQTFGHPTFSTLSGLNLFHGHNPSARGSWTLEVWERHRAVLLPIVNDPRVKLAKNEYEETQAYKKIATEWARSNPKKEIALSIRKAAIYFIPHNFESWRWNVITLAVHMGFILFSTLFFFKKRPLACWILLAVTWSMFIINIMFFVEYRWRYYVEPFMALCAVIAFADLYRHARLKFYSPQKN